ncbi:hypothetical protein CW304_05220 [Bacillus sp. UFRGS-B20]|nr:hypothetical protein CW304_05220 [Bacillus sp. UFRGS-B20]
MKIINTCPNQIQRRISYDIIIIIGILISPFHSFLTSQATSKFYTLVLIFCVSLNHGCSTNDILLSLGKLLRKHYLSLLNETLLFSHF